MLVLVLSRVEGVQHEPVDRGADDDLAREAGHGAFLVVMAAMVVGGESEGLKHQGFRFTSNDRVSLALAAGRPS